MKPMRAKCEWWKKIRENLRGRRLLREELGSAVLELSLILSVLGTPLIVGTAQMGSYVYDSIEVGNAAHAGAMYGMMSSTYANDTAAITTAAQEEAPDFGSNLTVTPTVFFACSQAENGTQYSSQTTAAADCSGNGNHPIEFIQVQVSATATPIVKFPGLPATLTLTGNSVMEVEE